MPTRAATTRAVQSALLGLPHFGLTILPVNDPLKNTGPALALTLTLRARRPGVTT
jgi:hypothetical protein